MQKQRRAETIIKSKSRADNIREENNKTEKINSELKREVNR